MIMNLTWDELVEKLDNIREKYPHRQIWQVIENDPITLDTIDFLIKQGWWIEDDYVEFACSHPNRRISLEKGVNGYERDKSLFHEIVHACYGDELSDTLFATFEHDNRMIADWLGRQLRADPALLRYTIHIFNLKSSIYDLISYQAFSINPVDLEKQLVFPFAQSYYETLKRVRMD